MIPQASKALTVRQRALIEAIDSGVTSLRDLADVCDYSSISVVKYNLETLAELGMVVLVDGNKGQQAFNGCEFASGWDAAARLAGNPDA